MLWLVCAVLSLLPTRDLTLAISNDTFDLDLGSGVDHEDRDYRDYRTNPRCEPLTVPLCRGIPYNETIYPNLLQHRNQQEASVEVDQYTPLVKIGCSPHTQLFLCSLYAPVCTVLEEAIPPCRSLCQHTKDGCLSIMTKFGFDWPPILECNLFPVSGLCVGEENPDEDTTTESTVTYRPWTEWFTEPTSHSDSGTASTKEPTESCQPFSTPVCRDVLPYNSTLLPNVFNHTSVLEATLSVHEWRPLITSACSSFLAQFVCSVHFPGCSTSQEPCPGCSQVPCRGFCAMIQRECADVMTALQYHWPGEMSCDNFPIAGHCMDIGDVYEGDQTHDTISCEPVLINTCRNTNNMTSLPNKLRHQSQEEAAMVMNQFTSLVTSGCDVIDILCVYFVPPCQTGGNVDVIDFNSQFCSDIERRCYDILSERKTIWPLNTLCSFRPILVNKACNVQLNLLTVVFVFIFLLICPIKN